MIKLSILILTTPRRLETFCPKIIRELECQVANRNDIEIICVYDNLKRSVGHKRNDLLYMAQGKYVTFIDDDDRIASDYIDSIMKCIEDNYDVDIICFHCICTINNMKQQYCKYSKDYNYEEKGTDWCGKPAHTMVWKATIAKKHHYEDKQYGEDVSWVKKAVLDIHTEVQINKVLYYYDFNGEISETRG